MGKLGKLIREGRKGKALTVHSLADAIGKTAGYVSRLEVRDEVPTADLILQLGEILGIPADRLIGAAKHDLLNRAKQDVDRKFEDALTLYRRKHGS